MSMSKSKMIQNSNTSNNLHKYNLPKAVQNEAWIPNQKVIESTKERIEPVKSLKTFENESHNEFDTSVLVKRREENEACLEEIEKSIIENIESTRSIINRNSSLLSFYENRPLAIDSVIKIRSSMMETMRPKELYKDIKSTDSKMVSKSPKTKGQSCNKGKLNYHKIKQKSKPQSGQKNQDNFEFTSIESWEGKNVNNGQTPSQVTEISSRRMASINKNKTFKEDIINDNKEMFRAISHISFTNQTDMFDNYDSNNSNGNDRNNEEVRVKDIDDDDDENLAIDVEEERINILSNSFLNLTTTKNKFFNKSISSEQECPQNHDENEEITNKSMADVILRIESYNNSSFELKNKCKIIK